MKKVILALAGAAWGWSGAMGMEVNGQYYCPPEEEAFRGPDTSEAYIAPWHQTLYSGYDPVEVRALPSKGWAVDSWYVTETYPSFSFTGTHIADADGALSVFRPFRAKTGVENIVEYLGVKFRWLRYNLAYDSNGGTTVPGQSGLAYTNKFALAGAPTRDGYDFAGWKDSTQRDFAAGEEVTGSDFAALDSVREDGRTVTLTAQWNEKSYAVGSTGENCTVTVAPSARFTEALEISWQPDQENFTCPTVKVHAGADATGIVLATYTSGTSATFTMSSARAYHNRIFITASYEVYTLKFDPNGGTCDEQSRRVEYGACVTPPALPEPRQYKKVFDGWFLDDRTPVGSMTVYGWKLDVTAKAAWKDAELATIETEVVPEDAGAVSGAGEYLPGEVAHLKVDWTADGYSFCHWTNAYDQTSFPTAAFDVTVTGSAKYTAVFTGNVYTVKFDCDEELAEAAKVTCPKSVRRRYGEPFGELPAATVGNADYRFVGWMDEDDQPIEPTTLFLMTGKNNYVYAHVVARPAYWIRFDGNEATAGEMDEQRAYCGEEVTLAANRYAREAHVFTGWTNAVGTAFADGVTVTDLAPAGETAVLYATWRTVTLAEAMHANALEWTTELVSGDATGEPWTVAVGDDVGSNTASCVRQEPSAGYPQALTAQLDGEGTLTFWWKPAGGDGLLWVWCDNAAAPDLPKSAQEITGKDGVWSSFTLAVPSDVQYVHIMNYDFDATADIDQMRWMPKGRDPMPGEPVAVDGAAVENGVFKLSVYGVSGVDYGVWTNADLTAADRWGLMGEPQPGKDGPLDFSWTIRPEMPRLFFRAHQVDYR